MFKRFFHDGITIRLNALAVFIQQSELEIHRLVCFIVETRISQDDRAQLGLVETIIQLNAAQTCEELVAFESSLMR